MWCVCIYSAWCFCAFSFDCFDQFQEFNNNVLVESPVLVVLINVKMLKINTFLFFFAMFLLKCVVSFFSFSQDECSSRSCLYKTKSVQRPS